MNSFRLFAFVMLMVGLLVVGPAAASDFTVGQFVQQLAESKKLDADNPQIAASSLSARGTALPTTLNLSKRLTEGDVVEIARAMGLNLTSSQPENDFGRIQADRFLTVFATEFGIGNSMLRTGEDEDDQGEDGEDGDEEGDGPAFDPFTKGKGKGKQVTTETAP